MTDPADHSNVAGKRAVARALGHREPRWYVSEDDVDAAAERAPGVDRDDLARTVEHYDLVYWRSPSGRDWCLTCNDDGLTYSAETRADALAWWAWVRGV